MTESVNFKEKIQQLVCEIKEQGYENICFMQPALNIGGGPLIEAKIADYLSKNTDLNIYFCDYKDGYGKFFLKTNPKVKILEYKEKDINFPLQEKCILITNSTRAVLVKNMHPESKLLFWHYETTPCGWNSVFIDNETKKYLTLAKKNNAMVYHDWSGRDSLSKSAGFEFTNKDYIHIVIPEKNKYCKEELLSENELNIGFLSRLAHDKIQGLFYLFKNLASFKTDQKKKLHFIGDGNTRKKAEIFCKNYEDEIEFIFTGTIPREDLDDYLINNVDLLFGVGTCVLESAALKIPSVICLLDLKEFDDTDALWLYNSKEYCVGLTIDEKKEFDVDYTSIHKIIDSVYAFEGKKLQGEKCYQYFIKNHSNYDELIKNFLTSIKNTTLTTKMLKKCIKYIPYNLYSYELSKIFGIPFIKKINFCNKTKFMLFGLIPILKITQTANQKKYYLGKIHFKTVVKKNVYSFPTAKIDDRKIYMKGNDNAK